jgi:uncharacterized protein YbjT (DUF2867 family)
MKAALIAGATGLCGKKLLYSLLSNKEYIRVFILVRKELAIKDSKLTQIVFNYENEQDYQNLPIADIVFCCLGTTIKKSGSKESFKKVDLEYPDRLAKACWEKGYKKLLVITAVGADKHSGIFYNKVKGEVEEKIKSYPFGSIFICRPSILLGDRADFRVGEEIGKFFAKFSSALFFGSFKKYKAIEASCVSNAMLVLANGDETGIHIIESDRLQSLGEKR